MKNVFRMMVLGSGMSLATVGFAIDISPTNSSSALANALLGNLPNGISLAGSSFEGADGSAATYSSLQYAPFNKIRSGVLLTSGSALLAAGPNNSESEGIDNGGPQATFDNYDGLGSSLDLNDVCRLNIDFNCSITQKLSFNFSFGSEEYYEYVKSPYNDAFLAFLDSNPVSLALDSNENPITVNNRFFGVDNRPDGWSEYDYNGENYLPANGNSDLINELQYDGFTPVLKTTFTVTPGHHRISFVIGDAGDNVYDSGVFISKAFQGSNGDDGTEVEDAVPEPASIAGLMIASLGLLARKRKNP